VVDGDYADAFEVGRQVARHRDWYSRSGAVNPYVVEGVRTLGLEIAAAVDADWVALSMGNGTTLAGCWKGLAAFDRLGHADGTPRLLGVQAEGASAIHDRFHGVDSAERPAGTVAGSIDVTTPHNAAAACHGLRASGGTAVTVDDDAMLAARRRLGEAAGVYAERAAAAPVAGIEVARERGIVGAGDTVVVVATGTGLKDDAVGATDHVDTVPPDVDPEAVLDDRP
jgi:threonine synthase